MTVLFLFLITPNVVIIFGVQFPSLLLSHMRIVNLLHNLRFQIHSLMSVLLDVNAREAYFGHSKIIQMLEFFKVIILIVDLKGLVVRFVVFN